MQSSDSQHSPHTILHIDGDAFFASCEQAMHPEWRGRPVVTGRERGIVSAASYEAKARGISRGIPLHLVKRLCPEAIIVSSDYDAYMVYSRRMYEIVRRYAPVVEEYSIDECFADVTGMEKPLGMSYRAMALRIQEDVARELDIGVSIGVAPTKTLAKVGSKWKKPRGCFVIGQADIESYLRTLPVESVWGIGRQLSAKCMALGVQTAWELASKPQGWVTTHFDQPFVDTWRELRGEQVLRVAPAQPTRASIQKTRTFTPPSAKKELVFGQLLKNLENSCIKARKYGLVAKEASIFLKSQDFRYVGTAFAFMRATAYPHEAVNELARAFDLIHRPGTTYRATGVTLFGLVGADKTQLSLFESVERPNAMKRVYAAVDAVAAKFGKHAVHLAASATMHGGVWRPGDSRAGEKFGSMTRLSVPRTPFKIPMLAGELN